MHGRRSCSSASMLISDFPMTADGASSSSRHGCEEGIRTIFLSFLPSSPTLYVPQYPLHLIALLHFGTRYLFLVSNTGSNARASSSCLISARSASRLPAATESQLPHTPSSPRASEQVSAAPAPPQDDEGHPLTSTVDGRRPRQAVARGEAEAGTLSPSPPLSPVHEAAASGRVETLSLLLQFGSSLEERDTASSVAGDTPLSRAVREGQLDCACLLYTSPSPRD